MGKSEGISRRISLVKFCRRSLALLLLKIKKKKKKIRCSLPDKVSIHSAYDSTSKAAKVLDYTKFKEVIVFDDGMADYIT